MTEASTRRAVVVGGGIAGLASGLALARTGHRVVILERQPAASSAPPSGGWHLWSNAMQALAKLGVEPAVREHGAHLERSDFITATGRPIASWPIGDIGRRVHCTDIGISRAELHRILRQEFSRLAGAESLRAGVAVAGVRQHRGVVEVVEADGTVHEADVVIGADGIRSTIRRRIAEPLAPRYAGYVQWQAVLPRSAVSVTALRPGTEVVMFGRRARAVVHEIGDDQVFWAAILYGDAELRTAVNPAQRLLQSFAQFPAPLAELIRATPESEINAHAISDLPPLRHWVDGSIALVGDAAHAMTTNLSQGACLALEDAVVLADCLAGDRADGRADVAMALVRYQERRKARAQSIARQSWRIAGLCGWRSGAAVAIRDQLMRIALPTVSLRDHERFVATAP